MPEGFSSDQTIERRKKEDGCWYSREMALYGHPTPEPCRKKGGKIVLRRSGGRKKKKNATSVMGNFFWKQC